MALWITWFPPVALWTQVSSSAGPFVMFVVVFPVLVGLVYWVNGFLLLAIEAGRFQKVVDRYKIQPKRFNFKMLPKLLRCLAFNTLVVIPFICVLFYLGHTSEVFP